MAEKVDPRVHKAKTKANKSARKAHGTIKYSGAKLHEKGVVLEIEGLPQNQFKNVQFEIAPTSDPGIFEVSAKIMGVDMEKVELIFQDLLQLQYEGVAVMEMFGKTKINVNLLIFLINKKFYSSAARK